MQTPNEVIELAEKHSQEVARFGLEGLHEARRRANALLVLLLAGGGALAAGSCCTGWGAALVCAGGLCGMAGQHHGTRAKLGNARAGSSWL